MAVNPPQFVSNKPKTNMTSILVMAIAAVILGLIASAGIWQYLSKTQEKVKKLSATRAVVVAAKDIPAGTKIAATDLLTKQLPVQAVPKNYPSSVESIKGHIAKNTIQAEEIITESRLAEENTAKGLQVVIPPGQRAITVKVTEITGVGGFINPGDNVDILATFKRSDGESFSKTILQNVLVIAVGEKILDPNTVSSPEPKIVSQITFALNPTDSEKLTLASETGQLHLILRPYGEKESLKTIGANLADVYGEQAHVPKEKPEIIKVEPTPTPTPAVSQTEKNSIEVILGSQRINYYY